MNLHGLVYYEACTGRRRTAIALRRGGKAAGGGLDAVSEARARWLAHAEFFVGLSSGLSWLAWAVGTPVAMISGFTHPTNEFATPYRVINYHVCNSCWNDPAHRFDHKDFLWCPRHKDTPRQFECTRLITADHVKAIIRSIPGFGVHPISRANSARKPIRAEA